MCKTRFSIGVSKQLYDTLIALKQEQNRSLSNVVETLLESALGNPFKDIVEKKGPSIKDKAKEQEVEEDVLDIEF